MAFSAKYALVLVALCCAQAMVSAHVRRSAEGTTPLQELLDNAKAQLKAASEDWNKFVSSANLDEVKNILEGKSKELEERAKSVMEELKRQYEAHGNEFSEKASAAFNEATARINASIENLKAQAPGQIEEAAAFQQRFEDTFKRAAETMFEESGKLAKAAGGDAENVHDALTNLSRTALYNTMEVMQKLRSEVNEAIKKVTTS